MVTMPERVIPVLITVPFPGKSSELDRQAFVDRLIPQMTYNYITTDDEEYYGLLNIHPFKTFEPIPPSKMYETLQRETGIFSSFDKDIAYVPRPCPRYSGKHEEVELEWYDPTSPGHPHVIYIADDPKIYQSSGEQEGAALCFWRHSIWEGRQGDIHLQERLPSDSDQSEIIGEPMTVVLLRTDHVEADSPEAGVIPKQNQFAAELLDRDPAWCQQYGIEAIRIDARNTYASIVDFLHSPGYFFHWYGHEDANDGVQWVEEYNLGHWMEAKKKEGQV